MQRPAYFRLDYFRGSLVVAALAGLVASLLAVLFTAAAEADSSEERLTVRPVFAPFPQRTGQLTPAQGRFLIAARDLRDPNFLESVVLLLDYDAEKGAMGLIVNHPTDVKLSDLIEIEGAEDREETIYIGGPVERMGILVLVRSGEEPDDARHVFDDVYVSSSRPFLEELLNSSTGGEDFRLYAGYSGWAPGQLEFEIERGSWHILPGKSDAVFDARPDKVWKRLIDRTSVRFARAAVSRDRGIFQTASTRR